jgi:hypothetical protein
VSDLEYSGIKVVKSAATSDHLAIVAYTGVVKNIVGKTRRVCTFRKHTVVQNSHFLASVSDPVYIVNFNGDPQEEYDKLYRVMASCSTPTTRSELSQSRQPIHRTAHPPSSTCSDGRTS